VDEQNIAAYLGNQADRATGILSRLIEIPSVAGGEGPVAEYLHELLAGVADVCEFVPVTEAIKADPDYSSPLKGLKYGDRPNLRVVRQGSGGGKSVIFNTHMDVVPPSRQHEQPFTARLVDGNIYGRGACDAKGQIATLCLLLMALDELAIPLAGDVEVHFVIEEEVGGNGTVAMVRQEPRADACIVLEPTGFGIHPQIRGAVWFEVSVYGRAGHSGAPGGTVSALYKAIDAIEIFKSYHKRILAESRGHYPLFDQFENPMPLTIGQLEAGDFPSQAPQTAVFKGVLGLLPDRTKEQVMAEMRQALRTEGDEWLAEHFEIDFTYRHDASIIEPDHELVQALERAAGAQGVAAEVAAMTASCDAWMYNNQLGIPTVVFGPGELGVAHSNQEHIAGGDLLTGAGILLDFVRSWCG